MNRADSPAWRRTGLRLAAVVLATVGVAALPAAPALAAPARHVTTSWGHVTTSWGHVNAPDTQAKPVVLPGNGRSWALRTR